jgi:hypothetical protein
MFFAKVFHSELIPIFLDHFTMKNQPAQTVNNNLHTCVVCKQTGKVGAKWNFFIGDSNKPQRVHKPCGEMLQKSSPEGVRTALVPSPELREEWRNKRMTQNFWDNAFANAKPLKASATPVALPQEAPTLVAQAA